jgi:hypothetical protein
MLDGRVRAQDVRAHRRVGVPLGEQVDIPADAVLAEVLSRLGRA